MSSLQTIQPTWTDEDKALIKETVAKGTSDSEFKLFLYTASKFGLDPLAKQVWCIKYGNAPAAIFAGRDGFLHIAHKSGFFDGMETEAVKANGKVTGAICRVYRKDMTRPFVVEVSVSEYSTGKSNWNSMPETMIKKVAESQCLRKAFDISGLYAPEEMERATVDAEPSAKRSRAEEAKEILKKWEASEKPSQEAPSSADKNGLISQEQYDDIVSALKDRAEGLSSMKKKALHREGLTLFGVKSLSDIPAERYEDALAWARETVPVEHGDPA